MRDLCHCHRADDDSSGHDRRGEGEIHSPIPDAGKSQRAGVSGGEAGSLPDLTLIEALLVFFLAGGQTRQLPLYLMMVLLSTLGLSFLGAIAGLAAKDQASAGTVRAPLLLIALIPPLFSGLSDMLAKFAVLVPTTSFQTIFLSALDGKPVFSGENPGFCDLSGVDRGGIRGISHIL